MRRGLPESAAWRWNRWVPSDEPSEETERFLPGGCGFPPRRRCPLVILTMGELVTLPVRDWIGHQTASYLEFLLATPIHPLGRLAIFSTRLGLGGEPIAEHVDADQPPRGGGLSLFDRRDVLARSLSRAVPDGPRRRHLLRGSGGYRDAGFRRPGFWNCGREKRTGDAIRALLDLAPKTARRILPDGTEYDAPLENIMEGRSASRAPGRCCPGRRDGDRRSLVAGREAC